MPFKTVCSRSLAVLGMLGAISKGLKNYSRLSLGALHTGNECQMEEMRTLTLLKSSDINNRISCPL